jgi:hypothetical protein
LVAIGTPAMSRPPSRRSGATIRKVPMSHRQPPDLDGGGIAPAIMAVSKTDRL